MQKKPLRIPLFCLACLVSTALGASGQAAGKAPPDQARVPGRGQLEEQMRTDMEGLEAEVHRDGRRCIHLKGRFLHMSAAVRDSSGRMRVRCFSNHAAMERAMRGEPAVSPPSGERVYVER